MEKRGGDFKLHQKQLANYKQSHPNPLPLATANGAPIGDRLASLTVGPNGPMLMHDIVFFDEMAKFNRERIPERVVHAKGGGAHGFFEVTSDEITKYCKADLFSAVGKKTPMFMRFSTVAGESGAADTARDPRGFAMKFYTEEGNWDLVGNNTPVFFIRDTVHFPQFIHTQKRNPVTMLRDINSAFDFYTKLPESTHQVMILYSDRGTPDGFRFMHGYGGHTFKLVNQEGNAVYCKFHVLAKEIKTLTADVADKLKSVDPDYAIRDLYDAIELGDYPQWTFYVQIMTFDQAREHCFNPFDITKVWPHGEFPLIEVGKITLNKNPENYFAEVEQVAFCPARLVPGIEASPDKMLQGRLFSYHDTQLHRLGTNYMQIPINCPYRARPKNYQRDGFMTFESQGSAPIYHPNSYNGPAECVDYKESVFHVSSDVDRYSSSDDDNYTQPQDFWLKVLDDGGRARLVDNLVVDLHRCKPDIQERTINMFSNVHTDFGKALRKALDGMKQKTGHAFQSEGPGLLSCRETETGGMQQMKFGTFGKCM